MDKLISFDTCNLLIECMLYLNLKNKNKKTKKNPL